MPRIEKKKLKHAKQVKCHTHLQANKASLIMWGRVTHGSIISWQFYLHSSLHTMHLCLYSFLLNMRLSAYSHDFQEDEQCIVFHCPFKDIHYDELCFIITVNVFQQMFLYRSGVHINVMTVWLSFGPRCYTMQQLCIPGWATGTGPRTCWSLLARRGQAVE